MVEIELDRGRGKGGQRRLVAVDLAVEHDSHARIRSVKPGGDLAVGHNENIPNPGSVHFQRAQAVSTLNTSVNAHFSSSLSRKRLSEVAESESESSVTLCLLLYSFS